MKNIVTVSILVITAIGVDTALAKLSIPIITMDLILIPISIFIVYLACSPSYLSGKDFSPDQAGKQNVYLMLGLMIAMLALLSSSIFMIYLGFSNPLKLYMGVRGGGHGYTLAIMGLALLLLTISTIYATAYRKFTTKQSN